MSVIMPELMAALLGRSIAYSRSPAIFAAMGKLAGIRVSFDLIDVEPEYLAATLQGLPGTGLNGLAVTVPYKQAVMRYLDEIDEPASRIGAVNSISIKGGRTAGYNTDVLGFSEAVRDLLPAEAAGGSIVLLGAGGAARAVCVALERLVKPSSLMIVARESATTSAFMQWTHSALPAIQTSLQQGERVQLETVPDGSILVNCTPLGGFNAADQSPFSDTMNWPSVALYCDLNYNADNPLTALAASHDVPVMDGRAMLVHQAMESFSKWTGIQLSFDEVYSEVFHKE